MLRGGLAGMGGRGLEEPSGETGLSIVRTVLFSSTDAVFICDRRGAIGGRMGGGSCGWGCSCWLPFESASTSTLVTALMYDIGRVRTAWGSRPTAFLSIAVIDGGGGRPGAPTAGTDAGALPTFTNVSFSEFCGGSSGSDPVESREGDARRTESTRLSLRSTSGPSAAYSLIESFDPTEGLLLTPKSESKSIKLCVIAAGDGPVGVTLSYSPLEIGR